jgi:tetratricopeptide (TPR) repeat protein
LRRALQSVEANPQDPDACYAAGYYLEALGRFLPAATYYLRAAELQSDNREAWLAWGRTLAAGGEAAAAVAAYERILARWPDDWQAHANIATQLMQPAGPTYRPDEAVAHAERARATGPADMRLQLTVNLAEVCASVGRADRAAALYEEVLKTLPAADPQRSRYEERLAYLRRQ